MHCGGDELFLLNLDIRVQPIHPLANIMGKYWVVTDVMILAYDSQIPVRFQAGKKGWCSDIK